MYREDSFSNEKAPSSIPVKVVFEILKKGVPDVETLFEPEFVIFACRDLSLRRANCAQFDRLRNFSIMGFSVMSPPKHPACPEIKR